MIYGDQTLAMIQQLAAEGVDHMAVLMRHSARDFHTDRHDLENQLTDEGRDLSERLGRELPKEFLLRGYSSPAQRCIDTNDLALAGHAAEGGEVSRNRVVEALGVFYVLDQMRMFMAMREAEGQEKFLPRWYDGQISSDIMMPARLAASLVAGVAAAKLSQPVQRPQIDLLCSHDMTLYTVRDQLLGQSIAQYGEVAFLDSLVVFEREGSVMMQSHHGEAQLLKLGES